MGSQSRTRLSNFTGWREMKDWCQHHMSGHKDLLFNPNVKCQELHLLSILAPTGICSPQELLRNLSTSMPPGPWIHMFCSHYLGIFLIAHYLYVSVYVMPLALSFLHFGWQNSNPVVFCMGRTAYLKYNRVRLWGWIDIKCVQFLLVGS